MYDSIEKFSGNKLEQVSLNKLLIKINDCKYYTFDVPDEMVFARFSIDHETRVVTFNTVEDGSIKERFFTNLNIEEVRFFVKADESDKVIECNISWLNLFSGKRQEVKAIKFERSHKTLVGQTIGVGAGFDHSGMFAYQSLTDTPGIYLVTLINPHLIDEIIIE